MKTPMQTIHAILRRQEIRLFTKVEEAFIGPYPMNKMRTSYKFCLKLIDIGLLHLDSGNEYYHEENYVINQDLIKQNKINLTSIQKTKLKQAVAEHDPQGNIDDIKDFFEIKQSKRLEYK